MKRTFIKTIFRDFKKNLSRFIAIIAIVALGVGFLIGLLSATPDLKYSLDRYYDEQNMYDFLIKSTLGFEEEDIPSLKSSLPEAEEVEGYQELDYVTKYEHVDVTARVVAKAMDASINQITLKSGRLPENENECVAQNWGIFLDKDIIGEKLWIEDKEYEIVGICDSPLYYYKLLEPTTIGDGKLDFILYLDSQYIADYYITDVVVTVKGAKKLDSFQKEYFTWIKSTEDKLNQVKDSFLEKRITHLKENAIEEGYEIALEEAKIKTIAELSSRFPNLPQEQILAMADQILAEESFKKEILLQVTDQMEEEFKDLDARWYILNRKSNASYVAFDENASKVNKVAVVFPFFFFFIAGLIALTSITRLVGEDRSAIGTLKSLGYSKGSILRKYFFYAFFACLFGSTIGLFFGVYLIPMVIYICYNTLFVMPVGHYAWNSLWICLSILSMSLTIFIVMIIVCLKTLREKPNALLVPKAPKAGKRILLERIGVIWKHLKFKQKSSIRNVFRFKKNLIMMVVGIGGCTGLMMVGFGLRDAMDSLSTKQYEDIIQYDFILEASEDIQLDMLTDSRTLPVYIEEGEAVLDQDYKVTILYTDAEILNFMNLQTKEFKEDSVIISHQLSSKLHMKKGSQLELSVDQEIRSFTVSSSFESLIGNYVIVHKSQTHAKQSFHLIKLGEQDLERYDDVVQALYSSPNIKKVEDLSQNKLMYASMTDSVGTVIVLIILCSGALAVIVIYNLTNINVNERIREIATLKVLGYQRGEVQSYIFREIIFMSILGILFGFVLGPVLNYFVMDQISSPGQCFPTGLSFLHFLYSFIVTLLFVFVVLLLFIPKLKKIKMVESLKSVE